MASGGWDLGWGVVGAKFCLNRNLRVNGKQRKKWTKLRAGTAGERKHVKEEVKTRQIRDAVALDRTCSPPSSAVVDKIRVRFLPSISTGHSSNMPNLHRPARRKMFYRNLALPWGSSAVCVHDDVGDVQRAEVSRVWFSPFPFFLTRWGDRIFYLPQPPHFSKSVVNEVLVGL